MMQITFAFSLDQRVKTHVGTEGVITMLGVSRGGIQYYVETASNNGWFFEDQISI